jgi:hypothetical protein
MKRLDINFVQRGASDWRRSITPTGTLALLAALILSVHVSREHLAAQAQVQNLQERIAPRQRPNQSARINSRSNPVPEREIKQALSVRDRLVVPWDTLFGSLEGFQNDDIILLNLEPSAVNGEVRLSGEARNFPALLTYLDELNASRGLRDSVLVTHELRDDQPEQPIRFEIVSRWRRMQ